jgi:2-dehydropantoate 2-reductase
MRVVILGAGGVGAYLGGLLARAGNEVIFVDRWQEHVEIINRDGLSVIGEESFVARGAATTIPNLSEWPSTDLLILATKTTASQEALQLVRGTDIKCAVSVQNGFDVSDSLVAAFGPDRVKGMITLISGSLMGAGIVRGFHGGRPTFLGELTGPPTPCTDALMQALVPTGLRLVLADNITAVRWSKLIWWIPLVVVPSAARLTWGEAYVQTDLALLFTHIQRECVSVAIALGYEPHDYPSITIARRLQMSFDDAVADVLEMGRGFIADGMKAYEVAMLLDLKNRRKTEIDNTAGVIVREAHRLGLSVPYTEFAWRLIRSVEATFREG